jgi:hypothetical protein
MGIDAFTRGPDGFSRDETVPGVPAVAKTAASRCTNAIDRQLLYV